MEYLFLAPLKVGQIMFSTTTELNLQLTNYLNRYPLYVLICSIMELKMYRNSIHSDLEVDEPSRNQYINGT